MKKFFLFCILLISFSASAQKVVIRGVVKDAISNAPLEFAVLKVQQTSFGANTDSNGRFEIKLDKPGLYNIDVSYLGYKSKTFYEIAVDNYKPTIVDIQLQKNERDVKEVTIKGRKDKTEESPLSLRSIGVNEIQRNPGGNRDISKVIQSLPGVGSSVGFRNDIIIRGGGPAENRYYLDGMEIPNLNHFATQGANGGPVGILNVDFIQDVGYYAGAFPANRGNMLSSLFEFKMKNPRTDAWHGAFTVGTSDIGIRAEGPINDKSALMVSIRRSYLQLLFKGIGLPFLPTYNDMQIKYKYQIDKKNEISYLMLGAYDVSKLNLAENETDEQKYILGYLPEQNQWSYVNGIVYKHYKTNSFQTVVLSRNMLNNQFLKFRNNEEAQGKIWDYNSTEIENKLRIENTLRKDAWKVNYGVGAEYVKYGNTNYNQIALPNGTNQIIDFDANINFFKYGLFGQVSRTLLNDDLTLSVGTRFDGNTYSSGMQNLLKQYSPRVSVSYKLNDRINLNANTGIYHQLPSYTMMGYRDSSGRYINRENNLRYIKNTHYVAGVEYNTKKNTRFTIEGFYKRYRLYPQSVLRGLSLANEGGDFGVVGNEAVTSTSQGRSYGLELFAQQKLYKGFYGIAAITLFRSEFTNGNSTAWVASSWDQRMIVNLTAGKKLKRNWELGAKFRFTGGRPYTPYDTLLSSLVNVWDVTQMGLLDVSRINGQRLPVNHQLDFRVDKKYFFKRWNLNLYLDIQNAYGFKAALPGNLILVRDANGQGIVVPGSVPARYQTRILQNQSGTVLPTLGIIIEY